MVLSAKMLLLMILLYFNNQNIININYQKLQL